MVSLALMISSSPFSIKWDYEGSTQSTHKLDAVTVVTFVPASDLCCCYLIVVYWPPCHIIHFVIIFVFQQFHASILTLRFRVPNGSLSKHLVREHINCDSFNDKLVCGFPLALKGYDHTANPYGGVSGLI